MVVQSGGSCDVMLLGFVMESFRGVLGFACISVPLQRDTADVELVLRV